MAVVSPPFPGDEAARLEALREYHVLDTPPEPAFDQLTQLAAYLCQAPIALVVFVDEKRQWFKSRVGVDIAETPREWAICAHTIHEPDIMVVADATQDPRFADIPYVRDVPGIRFYAGTALRSPDGLALGTLCVLDRVPRVLDPGQLDALRALGRQAEAQLELRRHVRRLGEALGQERELRLALGRSEERYRQLVEDGEERFRALVELSADALTIIGADGRFAFASQSTRRVLGREPADLVGREIFELMHPEDVDRCRFLLADAISRPGVPLRAEFRYLHADGSWRHIEADGVNRLREAAVRGVVASFRDVSARVQAQQALRESEERFRQLAESLEDVVWVRSLEPRLLYVSPAFERIWGVSRDILYRDPDAVVQFIHPEDRAAATATAATMAEGHYDSQFRIVKPDGEVRWIRSRGVGIRDPDGVVRRIAGISQDITERKRAEEALRESEERFRQLAENVQDVFWIREVDPPRLLYMNPAYERLWGRLRQELRADPRAFLKGIHPEDRARIAARYERQGLEEYEEEYRVVQPDGTVRWVFARAFPVRDEGGQVRRVAGVIHDITARKAAEAELQAQKDLLANLLAVARATTELPSLEATLARTLEVMRRLTGAEAASLLLLDDGGRLARSLFSVGDNPAAAWQEESPQVLETGLAAWVVAHEQPAMVEDVEGDPRWKPFPTRPHATRSALCVPILSGRALVGVLTLEHSRRGYFGQSHLALVQAASGQMALALLNAEVFDALDRMAERQATLYEVLRASGGQLDPDAALRQAVTVIAQRTGWPNVAIAVPGADGIWEIRASNEELSRVGHQRVTTGVVGRAYATGRPQRVPDVREDPDYIEGAPIIRSEVAVPIRRGEQVMGVLNVESDVVGAFGDEEVGLAASLADAVGLALDNARLYRAVAVESARVVAEERRAQRLQEDLTHTLVHDLRNPLTSLQGAIEMLSVSDLPLSERQHGLFDIAERSTQRVLGLVNAILDVTRLEKGAMPVSPRPVALATMVEEALALHEHVGRQRQVELVNEVAADLPPAAADPVLLERILHNLLGNALKFTPEGGRVRVNAGRASGEEGFVELVVSDTGPGIPEQVRERLFQKFVTGARGGTGLGLAFCRLAVEAHGGRIWLADAPQGAAIHLTLPVSRASSG
jgi:PAS domain S-box-containing protein